MNWLQRARREIGRSEEAGPANSADRNPTALLAVPAGTDLRDKRVEIASVADQDDRLAVFEERAAIMEYDGGLSRADAEWAAWLSLGDIRTIH